MKQTLSQVRSCLRLTSVLIIIAGCRSDTLLNPMASRGPAIPGSPAFSWVAPQPCVLGVPHISGQTWQGYTVQTTYFACNIGAKMYFPPGDSTNGNYGIWWTDYEGLQPGELLTMFRMNFFNTAQEGPLEITFTKPVKNFSLTLYKCYGCGPDELGSRQLSPGHYMIAQDSAGQELGRADFTAGDSVSEKTLTGPRIRKVIVYPVVIGPKQGNSTPVDKVTQRASFAVDSSCPPVLDSVIDHPDFKKWEDSLNALSKLSSSQPEQREEWGAFVRQDPTAPGGMKIDPFSSWFTDHDPCVVSMPPPIDPDIIAVIHTHPSYKGENVTVACKEPNAQPYNPNDNGGGSDKDWNYAQQYGVPVYAISPQEIHKLLRDVAYKDRPKNPWRYRKQKNGCWAYKP